jgi:hypothetical protein
LLLRCPSTAVQSRSLKGPKLKGIFTILRQRLEILPGNLLEANAIFYLADSMHLGFIRGYTALIALPMLGILLWLMRQAELAAVRGSS